MLPQQPYVRLPAKLQALFLRRRRRHDGRRRTLSATNSTKNPRTSLARLTPKASGFDTARQLRQGPH